MKSASLWLVCVLLVMVEAETKAAVTAGMASWYGESHRGRLMANGKPFDPNKLTAASWFYPLGTKIRVSAQAQGQAPRKVVVTITDRGPSRELVRQGRIIDLAWGAFKRLGQPEMGLMFVQVEQEASSEGLSRVP
jgi:rare lipoprotein A